MLLYVHINHRLIRDGDKVLTRTPRGLGGAGCKENMLCYDQIAPLDHKMASICVFSARASTIDFLHNN